MIAKFKQLSAALVVPVIEWAQEITETALLIFVPGCLR